MNEPSRSADQVIRELRQQVSALESLARIDAAQIKRLERTVQDLEGARHHQARASDKMT